MDATRADDSFDFLVQQYEQIESAVVCEQFDNNFTNELTSMLKLLMECGAKFDNQPRCRGLMDTAFTLFRNLLRKFRRKLPDSVNLLLLKVIELRAGRWMMKEGIEEYYRNKRMAGNHQRGNNNRSHSTYASRHSSPVAFRSSGLRTSKSYGDVTSSGAEDFRPYHGMSSFVKNCCKDEVIIKNSDSGKVMGIKGRRVHMIEEMSDTIISFQKVSVTAKDRHVLISGPNHESIEKAKSLIDLTIRNNTSPIPLTTSDYEPFGAIDNDLESRKMLPSSSSSQYDIQLNLLDANVNIRVSNKDIGPILEQFIDKYNFENFVKFSMQQQEEQQQHKNGLKLLHKQQQQHQQTPSTNNDRDDLFRLKDTSSSISGEALDTSTGEDISKHSE